MGIPVHHVDGESSRPHGGVRFGKSSCLVKRSNLVQTDAAPTLVGLIVERSGDPEIPRFFHRGEMTEVLTLKEFGRRIINRRKIRRASKDDELIDVELIGRFGCTGFRVSHGRAPGVGDDGGPDEMRSFPQ